MSRKEFSEHTGIPVRTLEDWEAGRRTPPDYVPRLLAYQIKIEEIFAGKVKRNVSVILDADGNKIVVANIYSKGNNEVNNMDVIYDIANLNDIPELVRLRILYMIDDFGSITDEERVGMEKQLPGYFERELGKKLIAFVARAEGRLVAAAYLLIIEKPANPFFLNGLDSEVLSVYTEEGYRGKGICTNLMRNMIDYAAEHKISRIDLMATDEGYPIYKKLGFEDKVQKYKDMRLVVVNQ